MAQQSTESEPGTAPQRRDETVVDTVCDFPADAGRQTGDGDDLPGDPTTVVDLGELGAESGKSGEAETNATTVDSMVNPESTLLDPLLGGDGPVGSDPEAKRITVGELSSIRGGHSSQGALSKGAGDRDGDEVGGRYVLVGVGDRKSSLGEGTFGEVWQAYDKEFERDVALKILRPRMRHDTVLLRFELEKQALARMEHPNIAKVFDAGIFKDRRPFLAMELVRGKTLTDFCDGRQLSVTERLRMFIQICRAVHHAHDRFVLHRDLKPSNIMVVEQDGAAIPKVIDFGIAKVLDEGEFSVDPSLTREGTLNGTPAYMSPEQTRGNEILTARSDIYALGVILFELLTGDTPLSRERSESHDIIGVITAIRNEEPDLPSVTVTKADRTAPRARHHCGLPLVRLSRHLRGDLDVIALHALEKVAERRYASAADLAADVERHLNNEPILARSPGPIYRARKFVRRHWAATAVVVAVLIALVATAAVSTWSYFSVSAALAGESRARQAAVEAEGVAVRKTKEAVEERSKADAAREVAEQKKVEAQASRDAAILARNEAEVLINYMLFDLREQLEPLGRSRLLASVAERAEQYFSRQTSSAEDDNLARNRAVMFYNRGRILLAQGDVAGALVSFRQSRAVMETRVRDAEDSVRRFDLATASHGLGLALRASGLSGDAQPMFEEFLPFLRARHAAHDAEAGRLLTANLEQLGEMQMRQGQTSAALELFREQEALARELRTASPPEMRAALAVAIACEKVGGALQQLERFEEALPKFEEEVKLLRNLAGESLDDLMLRRAYIVGLEKLGNVFLALNRPEQALARYHERLRESEILYRVDPRRIDFRRDLAVAHQRLSYALLELDRKTEALEHARSDLQMTTAISADYPLDFGARRDLATACYQLGRVLLKSDKPTPAVIDDAKQNLEKAEKILRSLESEGKIDNPGKALLETLEKALTDLAKVSRSPASKPTPPGTR